AVYTSFTDVYDNLDVESIDDSFQAGTPKAYTAFVTGGARGGGGSNFTGSNSGTGSACLESPVPVEDRTWGAIKALLK
ncbi:MAG: hypothetical protein HKN21_02250, partial [Candidatus Eisenbacteria bacterium]|nr:hypothetical protein [Candidatus Eisenbacteria bacterium]